MINNLFEQKQMLLMGSANIVDEIERMMRIDASQRDLITASVAKKLSDVAAFAEIWQAIGQHQPKIQLPRNLDASEKKTTKRVEVIEKVQKMLADAQLAQLITPFAKFDYPAHKQSTQQNIEKMRLEEQKLDQFWQRIDDDLRITCGQSLHQLMQNRMNPYTLQRTPPRQPPAVIRPKDPGIVAEPKTKTKTRGQADPSKGPTPVETAEAAPQSQTFTLAARAYKVMSTLFPSSTQDRTAGKIVWRDFVHAFYKLDFEIRSLDGSAWYFEPSWRRDSPITFHEPHPSSEIRFNNLRFYASRLARKFGWSSKTFVQD